MRRVCPRWVTVMAARTPDLRRARRMVVAARTCRFHIIKRTALALWKQPIGCLLIPC